MPRRSPPAPDLRLDPTDDEQLRAWAAKFDISPDELCRVIAEVGTSVRAVGHELGRRALFGERRPASGRDDG